MVKQIALSTNLHFQKDFLKVAILNRFMNRVMVSSFRNGQLLS